MNNIGEGCVVGDSGCVSITKELAGGMLWVKGV